MPDTSRVVAGFQVLQSGKGVKRDSTEWATMKRKLHGSCSLDDITEGYEPYPSVMITTDISRQQYHALEKPPFAFK
jgi:hypothetical protein